FDLWSYANGDPINFWDLWGLAAAAIRAGWGATRIYASTQAADQSGVLDFAEGVALGIASAPTNPWGAYQTMQGYGAFAGWVVVELGNAWDSGENLGERALRMVDFAAQVGGKMVPVYGSGQKLVNAWQAGDWFAAGAAAVDVANDVAFLAAAVHGPRVVGAKALSAEGTGKALSSGRTEGALVAGKAAGAAGRSVEVTRWGRPGLEAGDWVMKGGNNWWNFFWSGKWQPKWFPGGNIPAAKAAGETFRVPASSVVAPGAENPVFNFIKGLLGSGSISHDCRALISSPRCRCPGVIG
ncbi:MAG: hypothetical protein RBU45_26730, partial [Myxococcota bacterium]|nr:hypothetical protein [Myxococcota bacterium]